MRMVAFNFLSASGMFVLAIISILLLHQGRSQLSTTARAQILENNVSQVFEDWMQKHKRVYSSKEEKDVRLPIFQNNYKLVEDLKKKSEGKLYTVGLNIFADMTEEEWADRHTCTLDTHVGTSNISNSFLRTNYFDDVETCESIDWAQRGIMFPVRYQGGCGSCWAMAAVSTVEAIYVINNRIDVRPLSVQQIVDCDQRSRGCDGGTPTKAYLYIIKNRGIVSEEDYPYNLEAEIAGECDYFAQLSVYVRSIKAYSIVYPPREDMLAKAVCIQPVSVLLRANTTAFKYYKGGIFHGDCSEEFSHAVVVTGFGTDKYGVQYWNIKNSWGSSWGEGGYMRMIRGDGSQTGLCGVAAYAAYPIL